MKTNIVKWGNSQGIRLPKSFLESLDLAENDSVQLTIDDDKIIISKVVGHQHQTIEKLFEGYDGAYTQVEIDWGAPVGKELW